MSRVDLDNNSHNYYYNRLSTISKKTIEEILSNRFNELYNEEIYDYEKIIIELALLNEYQIYFWSVDVDLIYTQSSNLKNKKEYILSEQINKGECLLDLVYRCGGKSMPQETNFQIKDGNHMGESGHMVQSELFYNYITNSTKKII
jgi:hypothetical protein